MHESSNIANIFYVLSFHGILIPVALLLVQDVLDVKSKLQQIETEVLSVKSKLGLKPAEMISDAKPNTSTGLELLHLCFLFLELRELTLFL